MCTTVRTLGSRSLFITFYPTLREYHPLQNSPTMITTSGFRCQWWTLLRAFWTNRLIFHRARDFNIQIRVTCCWGTLSSKRQEKSTRISSGRTFTNRCTCRIPDTTILGLSSNIEHNGTVPEPGHWSMRPAWRWTLRLPEGRNTQP